MVGAAYFVAFVGLRWRGTAVSYRDSCCPNPANRAPIFNANRFSDGRAHSHPHGHGHTKPSAYQYPNANLYAAAN